MIKLNVYAVFDSKAGMHMSPFLSQNHGVATRLFADQVADGRLPFKAHPEDYILFCLGSFDLHAGQFDNLPRAENLGPATQYVPVQGN